MKLLLVLGLSLIGTLSASAQEKGTWRPESKTARAITGEVAFAGEKFAVNFMSYTIADIHPVKPSEAKGLFDFETEPTGSGHLYRLLIPGQTKFLHKNTMCGAEDTQWMATFVHGKELQLAFFSGEKMPDLSPEAVATSTNLCGTYSYVR